MVLGIDNQKIVEKAVEYAGQIVNGHAVYDCMEDVEENRLFGCSLMNNETIDPEEDKYNIYLFKVEAGEDFDMGCYDCNFMDPDWEDPEYETKEDCCMECWMEEAAYNWIDEQYRDSIENQIREIINDIIWEDLDKLNTIRLGIYREFYSITQYQQELYNNNYEMEVLDALVDNAYDNGLSIDEPKEFLSGDVDELMNKLDYIRDQSLIYDNLSEEENDLAYNIHEALYAYDLDKALELLKE